MKNQLTTLLALAVLVFSVACHSSKKSNSSTEEITVWVNSDYVYDVVVHDTVGVMAFDRCHEIDFSENLEKDEFGFRNAEWKTVCVNISGFEFEKGFVYQVKVQTAGDIRTYQGGDLLVSFQDWKLVEVLSKEEDDHYQRKEVKTAWIGPQKMEARCLSPMTPPDCREMRHQAQFGELDKNGDWEPLYDLYEVPGYEEGYLYQVKYTKVYLSEFESRMIADHHGWNVENVEVLSKEKY